MEARAFGEWRRVRKCLAPLGGTPTEGSGARPTDGESSMQPRMAPLAAP